MTNVALSHDYLTQRGGAERVVLSLAHAFDEACVHTSFYDPDSTFPEFRMLDVRPMRLNAVMPLRSRHRIALPLLAPAFSRLEIEADVVICSSSGWAHGTRVHGRKLVYCHAPARWLYQSDRYAPSLGAGMVALALLRPALERWDRRAAASADRYVVNSRAIRDQVAAVYGIEAEVVSPPHTLDPAGLRESVEGVEPGFALCVSRLLPYKNVHALVGAFAELPGERLVVVGDGPERARLEQLASPNIRLVGTVDDAQLRWLHANARLLVAPAYEDFGLTPLEAASFGKPTVALRFGGYLDTVVEGETGLLVDQPDAVAIGAGLEEALARSWDEALIRLHAERFTEEAFVRRMRALVTELAGCG